MAALTPQQRLGAESIDITREAVSESERPVMLYSIGKDSSVMLHLATKAFYPSKPPFPLLHVEATWKFREMNEFRDMRVRELGMELIVYVSEAVQRGINPFVHGSAHTIELRREASAGSIWIHSRVAPVGALRLIK